MFRLKFPFAILFSVLLAACGGSSDDPVIPDTGGNDGGTDGGVDAPLSANTFYPMNFYMQGGEEYDVADGLFKGLEFYPLVQAHLLAPVNATTLAPVASSSINDYDVTIAGWPLDEREHRPQYQKVLDLPVQLHTAIVLDTSASNSAADKAALTSEIKRFISLAKTSSNNVIKNQKFTIWFYADKVDTLVNDFEDDIATLNTALDGFDWQPPVGSSWFSATYTAIVAAVGQYIGDGVMGEKPAVSGAKVYDFRNDGDNNLIDGYLSTTTDLQQLNLSSVVLISAGNNNAGGFDVEAAKLALTWQSFVVFDRDAESGSGDDTLFSDTTLLGKPLLLVNVGAEADSELASLATVTVNTNSTTNFNFADTLISAQTDAINERMRTDNLYLLRFPIPQRNGTFDTVVKSNTGVRDMTLTTAMDLTNPTVGLVPHVQSRLEIAGPNNAYLPGVVSWKKAPRLYPHVLWDQYDSVSTGFTWTVRGVSRTPESDGSIAITELDEGATVTLTNGTLLATPVVVN